MRRFTPPDKFDGYELERPLGRGGMGQVYLARDTVLDRTVAVKFVLDAAVDADARERFRREGRAIARLQHPNVVAIYALGEIDGVPYLVSEFIRGEGLDRMPKPVPWQKAHAIGLGLARALAAAHRRGVVHRDIKPENVVLSDEGEVKLLDFGIAKLVDAPHDDGEDDALPPAADPDAATGVVAFTPALALTRPGRIVGTPAFIAPEVWRGDPATFRSDIYALGCLLYVLCTGRPPHVAGDAMALRELVLTRDAAPLAEVAPEVDAAFAALVDRCLRRDPEERFANGNEARAALTNLEDERRPIAVPEGNPYRGLHAFEAEHRGLYFGRDSEIRAIAQLVDAEPLVVVAGDSGVGKSSLCRAGALPRLAELVRDGRAWDHVTVVPGRHPVRALAVVLAPVLGAPEHEVAERLASDPSVVARDLRGRIGTARRLVVFFDQLEELVTTSEPGEAAAVAELLGWLAVPGSPVRVLATVRGDFLSRLAALPVLADAMSRALYFLRPLTEERVREAIVGPAAAHGVRFESEALVDALVASAARAEGGLPLLQFTLAELWEMRDRATQTIPAAALVAIGGVEGALSRHADELIARLRREERGAARAVLLRLVRTDGTRARRTEAELAGSSPHARAALDALVRGRLVVARDAGAGASYEIAHEALVRAWPQLAQWMTVDAGARVVRERLAAAVSEWERLGRPRDALWTARQLAETASLDLASLGAGERAFVHASRRAHLRARALRAAAAATPLALGASYGVVSARARADLARRVDARLADATHLLDDARARHAALERAREAAFARYDAADFQGGETAWQIALAASERVDPVYARASQELETALLVDAQRADVRRLVADTLLERVLLAEERRNAPRAHELTARLALYDEGGERRARLAAKAQVTIACDAPNATIALARYERGDGPWTERPIGTLAAPSRQALDAGSYVATFTADGYATVRVPFVLARGGEERLDVALPLASQVPAGFAYVPAGRFLFGTQAEESVRRGFFHAAPIHATSTRAFAIARHETTFADWIGFLDALAPAERARRTPAVKGGGFNGTLALEHDAAGWRIAMTPSAKTYAARAGEPIVFPSRDRRASQDWLRFPVSGITADDAEAYVAWLARSGRVPGARLCREDEWERAARGADDRIYPHGDALAPDDANIDETYAKAPLAMGPDEVGSHPASASPFGVFDMAGNVWEWTRSRFTPGAHAARGGSYYFASTDARVSVRQEPEPSFRDLSVGLRVCADVPPAASAEAARLAE